MTKRINMAPSNYAPRTNQSQGVGLLPLIVIGAAMVTIYSGFDPETARAAAMDITRAVSSSLDSFMFSAHACSGWTQDLIAQ
jgi:hypothetical protein